MAYDHVGSIGVREWSRQLFRCGQHGGSATDRRDYGKWAGLPRAPGRRSSATVDDRADRTAVRLPQGAASPPAQSISVTGQGELGFTASASSSNGWLSVNPLVGSTP